MRHSVTAYTGCKNEEAEGILPVTKPGPFTTDGERSPDAMQRGPPSTQRPEACRHDLRAGFAGHPLRQCVRRAAELLLQVGLEDLVTSVLGRGHSERAAGEVTGARNGYSHHTLKTEAGVLHRRPPTVRDTGTPVSMAWPDELQRRTPALGALSCRGSVRGLATRDGAGRSAAVCDGRVSKRSASRATQALQAACDAGRTRDLGGLKVLYLLLDGQCQAVRAASEEQEGILAATARCEDGTVILLHLGLGPWERPDAWVAVLPDLTVRTLTAPLLGIPDGNPGRTRAVTHSSTAG